MRLLSENIAYYRRKKGMTQKELAEKTGLSRSFISQIENNSNTPSNDSLFKIAQVLGISVELLKDNEKNYVKDEDSELVNLLINITGDEKISWNLFDDPSEYYDGIYKSDVRGTEYFLYFKYTKSLTNVYIAYIKLEFKNDYDGYSDFIDSQTQDNNLLYKLFQTIQNLERDRSPKFKLINELEKIEKDENANPDNTSVPF
ncbi:helix-turn-helix domain-containing protein [Anaerococcus tetradius]|uniref:helix-turn-helix domain-containing protein n=1 Tax=Anaerococcus tetradius TaxID=33036 RepID=UPI0023F45298|nr:helix-turn-helix transcriptional regulator [Anaerococcus tetradius]